VDAPETSEAAAAAKPAEPPISFVKVRVSLAKGEKASIDLRKGRGKNYRLDASLEWDGRGAKYKDDGTVKQYGDGDLDVYFFCRNEETNNYVVISGDPGHLGSMDVWPFVQHTGDSRGATKHGPGHEDVYVTPVENGQLLVNVYQSIDNGSGAIDDFGRPRVVVRYGEVGPNGQLMPDADAITVPVGNTQDDYWANIARIDVQDGRLIVENTNIYSQEGGEQMPILDATGTLAMDHPGAPEGRSKKQNHGLGLTHYEGTCPTV
jgi:tellurite resistance protein TerA